LRFEPFCQRKLNKITYIYIYLLRLWGHALGAVGKPLMSGDFWEVISYFLNLTWGERRSETFSNFFHYQLILKLKEVVHN
jgi:hypothetical protein